MTRSGKARSNYSCSARFRMVREIIPSMVERKRGSIVMLTSSSVKQPIANLALLQHSAPFGSRSLAKTFANEYANHGIRVNHAVPGRIETARACRK